MSVVCLSVRPYAQNTPMSGRKA